LKDPAPRRLPRVLVAGLIAACLLAAYGGGLGGPFVFDDRVAIVENPTLRALWPPSVPLAPPVETPVAGRPVANLSFALSYALGGLSPRGYRVANLGLHWAFALLVFGLTRRTLERTGSRSPEAKAAATALLFALHPLASECVLYATQRTELLAALAIGGTLLAAERHLRSEGGFDRDAALAIGICALGMGCKESVAIAPFAVWLYDAAYVAGGLRRALAKRPALYLGLASTGIVWLALHASGPRRGSVGFDLGVSVSSYLAHQMELLPTYLSRVVWPNPLILDYGWPLPLAWSEVALDAGLVAVLLGLSVWIFLRQPRTGFPLALAWLALLPASTIPIATEVGAERRMYVPLAALLALAVPGAASLLERSAIGRHATTLAGVSVLGLALALGATTRARTHDYQSETGLWQGVVALRPKQPRPLVNLGSALRDAGRPEEAKSRFEAALALHPSYARAEAQLALLAQDAGDLAGAERHLRRAVERDPSEGRVRTNLGEILARRGAVAEAREQWRAALEHDPSLAFAANNLAWSLATHPDATLRDGAEAVRLAQHAVALTRGTDADLLDTLAAAYAEHGRFAEALTTLERTRELVVEPGVREMLEGRVRLYREGRPYRSR
jgi:Flp pilus assembly protein TadD